MSTRIRRHPRDDYVAHTLAPFYPNETGYYTYGLACHVVSVDDTVTVGDAATQMSLLDVTSKSLSHEDVSCVRPLRIVKVGPTICRPTIPSASPSSALTAARSIR